MKIDPSQKPAVPGKTRNSEKPTTKAFEEALENSSQNIVSEQGTQSTALKGGLFQKGVRTQNLFKQPDAKPFSNNLVPEGGTPMGKEIPGTKLNPQQAGNLVSESSNLVSENLEQESLTGKNTNPFKNILEKSSEGDASLGSQGLPLSAYLEPRAGVKPPEQLAPLNTQNTIPEIEKLVDRVMVGVNETGAPEFKIDIKLHQLGDVNITVTRNEGGLNIVFDSTTEKAGIQLGQNLKTLENALQQKGLSIQNLQVMIQNQPVSMSQMMEQPKSVPQDTRGSNKKDSSKGQSGREKTGAVPPKGGR